EAAAHFGIFALSVYGAVHYRHKDDYLGSNDRYDPDNNRELINQTTLRYDYSVRLATDMQLYSSYAAYRDARARDNSGYRLSAPRCVTAAARNCSVCAFRFETVAAAPKALLRKSRAIIFLYPSFPRKRESS